MAKISYEFLNKRFEISSKSETGLIWKIKEVKSYRDRAWNTRYAGQDSGQITIDQDGRKYYVSSISSNNDKRKVYNHKVVYAIYNKKDLNTEITIFHKDGDTTNNNPENLMESHNSEHYHYNGKKLHKNNKTGHVGIHYDPRTRKYIAQITFKMKKIRIGSFDTLEEAVYARQKFKEQLFEKEKIN